MHLRLRYDDLARAGVMSVFDWMVQQADDPDDLTHSLHPVGGVAGITQELLTLEKLENHRNHFNRSETKINKNVFYSDILMTLSPPTFKADLRPVLSFSVLLISEQQ